MTVLIYEIRIDRSAILCLIVIGLFLMSVRERKEKNDGVLNLRNMYRQLRHLVFNHAARMPAVNIRAARSGITEIALSKSYASLVTHNLVGTRYAHARSHRGKLHLRKARG